MSGLGKGKTGGCQCSSTRTGRNLCKKSCKMFSESSTESCTAASLLPRQAMGNLKKLFSKPLTKAAARPCTRPLTTSKIFVNHLIHKGFKNYFCNIVYSFELCSVINSSRRACQATDPCRLLAINFCNHYL